MLADMSTSSLSPRAILITGASSGIGAAIAREYAEGGVFLALSGRNAERLAAVAQDCRDAGADVEARPVDVVDRAGMADWIEGIDDSHPLDLVIANAGISSGTSGVDLRLYNPGYISEHAVEENRRSPRRICFRCNPTHLLTVELNIAVGDGSAGVASRQQICFDDLCIVRRFFNFHFVGRIVAAGGVNRKQVLAVLAVEYLEAGRGFDAVIRRRSGGTVSER